MASESGTLCDESGGFMGNNRDRVRLLELITSEIRLLGLIVLVLEGAFYFAFNGLPDHREEIVLGNGLLLGLLIVGLLIILALKKPPICAACAR